ncbi:MAG: Caspase family protein [Cyanobacteriota bacterium erpe_2018_sw_21hr_WHONDRS-SW48-000092_B_bin.40]|nr:Caspase family protein [Cyanobacteriota bacterium erpe_2018_sw_21hr_WHONDRS-SW48-000092_B_bin.40]
MFQRFKLWLIVMASSVALAGAADAQGPKAAGSVSASSASGSSVTSMTATPVADKWAVVVGVSEFADKAINLKYAAKDAADFRAFLVEKCHFAPDHVRLLTNEQATKENVLDLLGDSFLPRVALPDDLVVIYFSSHGSASDLDLRGVNYLVAHDTAVDRLYSTGIDLQTLSNIVKTRIHCNRALIILDACHSGGASDTSDSKGLVRTSNVDAAAIAQGTGRAVICSSSKTQSSWESKNYANGVFTKTLIDGFKAQGEKTTLSDAFKYLKTNVEAQVAAERGVLQTPVLEAGKWSGGELLLAVQPASPRAVPASVIETLEARSRVKVASSNSVQQISSSSSSSSSSSLDLQDKGAAAPPAAAAGSKTIPNILGSFMGSNGLKYSYWQSGKKCGWAMPQFGVVGNCLISDDGTTLTSSWKGFVSGTSTAKLELDASGKVVKISADDGTILTRMAD